MSITTTIVVPCYNEAERLNVFTLRRFARDVRDVSFLFVDDGSRDATPDRLQALHAADPIRFQYLRLAVNQGKAAAVRLGVLTALGRLVSVTDDLVIERSPPQLVPSGREFLGYWDADLAAPLAAIGHLRDVLRRRSTVELVVGSRIRLPGRRIQRSRPRRLLDDGCARAASLLLGLPIRDTQCGAKLFRAGELAARAFAAEFRSRWLFDVELLLRLAILVGDRQRLSELVYELPLDDWHEVVGSKRRWTDLVQSPRELANIWWRYRRLAAIDYDGLAAPAAVSHSAAARRAAA